MDIMASYLVLLRGINVGGKNKVSMKALKTCLEDLGFENVTTYIASGNAIVDSKKSAGAIKTTIEAALPKAFKLDSELIAVAVLSKTQLKAVIDNRPNGFGDEPGKYHSDALFLMGITAAKTMPIFSPREGVDKVWPGKGVIYSQRLSAERTKSRLSKIVASPAYKAMTIRSWQTTTKLMELMEAR
jgi:uncharacterized protein (DUF1697 family)